MPPTTENTPANMGVFFEGFEVVEKWENILSAGDGWRMETKGRHTGDPAVDTWRLRRQKPGKHLNDEGKRIYPREYINIGKLDYSPYTPKKDQ